MSGIIGAFPSFSPSLDAGVDILRLHMPYSHISQDLVGTSVSNSVHGVGAVMCFGGHKGDEAVAPCPWTWGSVTPSVPAQPVSGGGSAAPQLAGYAGLQFLWFT